MQAVEGDLVDQSTKSTDVLQNESPSASFADPVYAQQQVLQHEELPVGSLYPFGPSSYDPPSDTVGFPDHIHTEITSDGSPHPDLVSGVLLQEENPAFGGFMSGLTNTIGLGSSSLNWLDIQLLDSPVDPELALLDNPLESATTPCSPDSSLRGFSGGALPCLPSSNDAAFGHIPTTEQPVTKPHTSGPAPQQWPFDQSRDLVPCAYQLPPLREVLQTNLTSAHDGTKGISQCLINLFLKPRFPDLDETLKDCTILPAVHLVQRSIDCFFSDFHSILPMIHRPSWSLSSCPTVLLASMACIGAMFPNDENAMDKSRTLSKISARMIFWLGDSDSNKYHDVTYLIACCLYQIYSLGSGNWQMYQDADRSRGVLVGSLRGMGLLQSRISVEATKPEPQLLIGTGLAEVQKEWTQWIIQEQEKRVTWSCFEYDCSLCTLTGRRGAIDLSELPSRLPCAEELWDAPTGMAWRALGLHSPTSFGASVDVVLRELMAGRPIPSDTSLSSWAKRLCGQIIGRLLWDLKQLDTLSLSGWLGLTPLQSAQNQAKMSLLKSFDNLALAPRMSWNLSSSLCEPRPRGVPEPDQPVAAAKQQLEAKFAGDPRRTRRLVWHAVQITAVASEYLVSAPCEILRIFMGCIFLMTFAKYGRTSLDENSHDRSGSIVRLDDLAVNDNQRRLIVDWIYHGGPASIAGLDDIYSDELASHVSNMAQSLLARIQYWGLSQKFVKILQMFLQILD
ncbi:hypothetical protein N7450_005564 [Penicillium hetheringtonii]|uniref:Xylanolytic transcriptional activator regulatory domain-containing protein n=1 Tax=Penicillium hetheringtonii TaxID=911720 RepID=A0AAD6DIQ1_9EURO|nr:hypothetical protein N7450_005564 [Penicillium hetheringtonii]